MQFLGLKKLEIFNWDTTYNSPFSEFLFVNVLMEMEALQSLRLAGFAKVVVTIYSEMFLRMLQDQLYCLISGTMSSYRTLEKKRQNLPVSTITVRHQVVL